MLARLVLPLSLITNNRNPVCTNMNLIVKLAPLLFLSLNQLQCSPGNVARAKCEEYGKYVYTEEHSPLLHINAGMETVSKCGIVEIPLIIGGTKASIIEFPHMAAIGFGGGPEAPTLAWNCGGTLISEQYVMTAAHCMKDRENGDAQKVRLGTNNIISPSIHMQEIGISERLAHPQYSARSKYNDIALLRLDVAAHINEFVRPACLANDVSFEWSTALAIGFGRLAYENDETSPELMKVQLSNIKPTECKAAFKTNRAMNEGLQESQLCAGEMAGSKDTCQGDSGGPLQTILEKPYCMYNIIGITSFGKFCGFANSPGVYTRVASYIEWIETIVWQ